jgi:hypothetical protein
MNPGTRIDHKTLRRINREAAQFPVPRRESARACPEPRILSLSKDVEGSQPAAHFPLPAYGEGRGEGEHIE